MRLRAGLRALLRGPGEVQVGLDPRWAVRITDLDPDEATALVAGAGARAGAGAVAGPGAVADTPRLRHVGALLVEAGLAVPDEHTPLGAAADDAAWGLLRPHDEPMGRARRRADACAGVVGLGPTGLGVAAAFAAAGVGTVLLDDERPVRGADVGIGGYRWPDVGRRREDAAARVLRDVSPHVTLAGVREPDVLVVVESWAAEPGRAEVLLGSGVPHLSVVVREADTLVGPLVVPGTGPCLRCLDLHRADLDPAWPLLLSQLTAPEWADAEPATEPGPVAAVSAGLAAAAALVVLDGLAPAVGRTWEVGLPDAVPRERSWRVHPDCGCGAPPG